VKQRWIDIAISLALALVAWVIYRKILRLWWMLDDPNHLLMLTPVSPAGIFTRRFTALLGKPLFTPLHFLSMKLDLICFGPNPRMWYLHQLIAFLFLAPLQYAMLRLWCSRPASLMAALVTMMGVPVMNIVPVLMLRHYVEGAVFAFAAVILYVRGERTSRPLDQMSGRDVRSPRALSIASAVLYLIAALYKEIFVPLPLILGAYSRKKHLIPHVIAAFIYAALRLTLLGSSTESYDFVVRPHDRLKMIATLPFRAFGQFGIPVAIAVVICVTIVFIRMRNARLVIVAGFLAALLPILPVAAQLQPRWAFALWLVSASAIAFVELALPRYGLLVIGAVLITTVASFRVEWPRAFRGFMRMSDEARAFVNLGPNDILLNAETPPVTMQTLAHYTHAKGRALYDELRLCADPQPHRLLQYDATKREVVETRTLDCAHIRTAPLFAHFVFDDGGAFYWTLGPYRDGKYIFVLGDDIAYEVRPDAGFRAPDIPELTIRVRYESPAGWMTYSPDMRLDMKTRRPVDFDRR